MARPGISTQNTEKNTPRVESLKPQENILKIPKKYPKWPFLVVWEYFLGIFRIFSWGTFWESRILGRRVFFRYFPWKFREGRTRAIAVRRGSYEPLFLLNSGRFSLEK